MDDTQNKRASDAAATRKRRSSILKSQRQARTPFSELEFNVTTPTDTAKSRRVSFSRRTGVAEFVTNEATTTWKNVYEEHNKSLESSGNDSDIKPQNPPVAHLGKRIFDNQFEEVEAVDYIETITPSISNSLTNVNLIEQIATLESPSKDQVSAPQCNYELSALTEHQSKLFGNEFTITGVGEMSGRIEVNFSAIRHMNEGDDLTELEKDFGRVSNVVCHGPTDRNDISEYIEVDLNMTNVVKNDVCDMSITDTIKSPQVQNVSQNCIVDKKETADIDWVSDKENIAINPYAVPRESDNFAINDENNQVLVFDGKRLTLETEKTDKEYRKTLLPNSSAHTPQRKTIVLNIDDDLPNFVDSKLADVYDNDDLQISSMHPVNKIEIVSKNTTKHYNVGNLSITDTVHSNIVSGTLDKRRTTMMYEAEEANISMTQALPARIITETVKPSDRRRTIVYEQNAVDISMTQALPSNILQHNDIQKGPERREETLQKFNDKNTSVTVSINNKRKTLVFDDDNGNLSMTQALPNNIVLNQHTEDICQSTTTYDHDKFDLSITEAVPAEILVNQVSETVDRGQTTIYRDDVDNISFTKILPSNIISGNSKYEGKKSMTEVLPDNVVLKNRDLGKTLVYEDDAGNISITQCVASRLLNFDDKITENQNEKRKTIIYEDNSADVSMTEAIGANIIPSQVVPVTIHPTPSIPLNFLLSGIISTAKLETAQDLMNSSKIQNVKSDEIDINIDKKVINIDNEERNVNEEESNLDKKERNIDEKERNIDEKEINIDKKQSNTDEKMRNKKEDNFDTEDSVLAEKNKALEMYIKENLLEDINVVKTIISNNNIGNLSLSKPIPSDLTAFELNISENKNFIMSTQSQKPIEKQPMIIYHSCITNKKLEGNPPQDELSMQHTQTDNPFGEIGEKEDINDKLSDELSNKEIQADNRYDELSIKEDINKNPGHELSIKGSQTNYSYDDRSIGEIYTQKSPDELNIKGDISDTSRDKFSIKQLQTDNPEVTKDNVRDEPNIKEVNTFSQDELSIKEDISDTPRDGVGTKEIQTDNLEVTNDKFQDELNRKEINTYNPRDELSIKEDINDKLGEELRIKDQSTNNPYYELDIKEPNNDNLSGILDIKENSGNNLRDDIPVTVSENIETVTVASAQTIFGSEENVTKSESAILVSHNVEHAALIPEFPYLNTESNKIKTQESVLNDLLSISSSSIDKTSKRDKYTETEKELESETKLAQARSDNSLYFILDENTETHIDRAKSEETVKNESEKYNINAIISNFSSEYKQCDQKIQTNTSDSPSTETVERDIGNLSEKDDSKLHKSLKNASNTQELLNMISDFTHKARSDLQIEDEPPQSPKVIIGSGLIPIEDKIVDFSPKKLSFAPTRQSIVFSREDLLSNISMAQAALQKSHIELDDSLINIKLSPNDSDTELSKNACIDAGVVKTLQFDDESISGNSLKSDITKISSLKKTNFRDDVFKVDNNKANVIPTYLRDVSDSIKELMSDLVKPMADSLPFEMAGETFKLSKRTVSTTSTQIQANLLASSQIDIHDNTTYDEDTYSAGDSSPTVESSKPISNMSLKAELLPPCRADEANARVIIFDHNNPLNNILIGPLDNVNVHRYSPPNEPDEKSEDTFFETQSMQNYVSPNNLATKLIEATPSNNEHDGDYSYTWRNTPNVLSVSLSHKSWHQDRTIQNQIKEVKDSEINTDIAMKANKNSTTINAHLAQTVDIRHMIVKDSEVNTNIVMQPNEDLLKTSSSLTLVNQTVTRKEKGIGDVNTSPSKVLRNTDDVEFKLKQDIDKDVDQSSVTTSTVKKRHYSPGAPTKSNMKKTNDSHSPSTKIQKLSDSVIDSNTLRSEKDLDVTKQRLDLIKNRKPIGNSSSSDGTIQHRADCSAENSRKLVPSKPIDTVSHQDSLKSEVSNCSTALIPSSILLSSSYLLQLDNVSSFTSSKNLHANSKPSCTSPAVQKSQNHQMINQSVTNQKQIWQSGLQSSMNVNVCDSGVNIVAKIDMLPFMGSHECEWETSAIDTWCFRLLHGRIRLTIKLAHRHENVTRTRVRADTPVTDITVEAVQYEKKNPVAIMCVRFASETMRFIVSRTRNNGSCYARDIPQLLRRCAAVARVAVRWGRAMHDAKLHLAYTLDNDGHLVLKVANIPLRSVWEVSMDVELVVGGAGEVPWPQASAVRVSRVVSDVHVGERDVQRALHATPRDWGHVPRTLWRMFRYLKQKTRDDEMVLGAIPPNEMKPFRGMLKEYCEA